MALAIVVPNISTGQYVNVNLTSDILPNRNVWAQFTTVMDVASNYFFVETGCSSNLSSTGWVGWGGAGRDFITYLVYFILTYSFTLFYFIFHIFFTLFYFIYLFLNIFQIFLPSIVFHLFTYL